MCAQKAHKISESATPCFSNTDAIKLKYGSIDGREDGEYKGFDFVEMPNIIVMQDTFFVGTGPCDGVYTLGHVVKEVVRSVAWLIAFAENCASGVNLVSVPLFCITCVFFYHSER